jgi:hypothetical protein
VVREEKKGASVLRRESVLVRMDPAIIEGKRVKRKRKKKEKKKKGK